MEFVKAFFHVLRVPGVLLSGGHYACFERLGALAHLGQLTLQLSHVIALVLDEFPEGGFEVGELLIH